MGKYFEIGYVANPVWKGLNTQQPANVIDPAFSPYLKNFWLRNSAITSCPPFVKFFDAPQRNNQPLGIGSFTDQNNVIHTVSWDARGLWQLAATRVAGKNPWTYINGSPLAAGVPVSWQTFANLVYYTNGAPYLQSWDGIAQAATVVSAVGASYGIGSISGPGTLGGYFLYEMNNQLILMNVTFQNTTTGVVSRFPNTLVWSANGIPNQFDATVNTSAGFNQFLDVPDQFTGVMPLGPVAYLFRTNGITEQAISGSNNLTPFFFDHMWASNHGVGNVYPWSIAQFGSVGFFISVEQIYQMSVNNFSPVGGGARDSIMADLAQATMNPIASVVSDYAYGYIYLTYRISIPLGTFTRHYLYSVEDQNWTIEETAGVLVSGKAESVWL
jgi:hypothetical protein